MPAEYVLLAVPLLSTSPILLRDANVTAYDIGFLIVSALSTAEIVLLRWLTG